MDKEEWLDIKGFEGRYEISNFGRVRTIPKILKPWLANGHYQNIYLGAGNLRRVHRLVAQHFLPNPQGREQVNHRNGKKDDNRASNLEWVSRAENITHAYRSGLMKQSKLTIKDVEAIRVSEETKKNIAAKYSVSRQTIQRIKNNRTWKI